MNFREITENKRFDRNLNSVKILKKQNKGFTLVELIITLAILSLIVTMLFSINVFGVKSYAYSKVRSQKQYEIMMATDFITNQLRFASELSVLNTLPTPAAGYYDIYIDADKSIKYNKDGTATGIIGINGISDFSLVFSKVNDKIISFTVGKAGESQYDINTELIILNLSSSAPPKNKIIDVASGSRIGVRFKLIDAAPSAGATITPATTVTPSPTSTATPAPTATATASPTATPKPTATPMPTPKPTPLPTPKFTTNTNTEVVIEFDREISSLKAISPFTTLEVFDTTSVRFIITGGVSDKTTVKFEFLDADGVTKICSVYYKNNGNKWESIQLSIKS